jgi:hypothetical protein
MPSAVTSESLLPMSPSPSELAIDEPESDPGVEPAAGGITWDRHILTKVLQIAAKCEHRCIHY